MHHRQREGQGRQPHQERWSNPTPPALQKLTWVSWLQTWRPPGQVDSMLSLCRSRWTSCSLWRVLLVEAWLCLVTKCVSTIAKWQLVWINGCQEVLLCDKLKRSRQACQHNNKIDKMDHTKAKIWTEESNSNKFKIPFYMFGGWMCSAYHLYGIFSSWQTCRVSF